MTAAQRVQTRAPGGLPTLASAQAAHSSHGPSARSMSSGRAGRGMVAGEKTAAVSDMSSSPSENAGVGPVYHTPARRPAVGRRLLFKQKRVRLRHRRAADGVGQEAQAVGRG